MKTRVLSKYRIIKVYFDHEDGKLRNLEFTVPENYGDYVSTSVLFRKEIEDEYDV